jgi:D-psicose/D-tagatose/L-ribulose 3-epimerase
LDAINYRKWVAIESFVPDAGPFSSAMHVWRHLEQDQDEIARKGLAFLRGQLGG